jgi:hypothetical protein
VTSQRCNRGACDTGLPATWWNTSTRAYYCVTCARQINAYSPGLCVERPALYSRLFGTSRVHLGDDVQTYCGKPIETTLPLKQPRAVLLTAGPARIVDCEECLRIHVTRLQGRWTRETFGDAVFNGRERALRFLEEAIELVQAEGLTAADVARVLDHVYAKPPGEIRQEIGGVGITLLGYCAAKGVSADDSECAEAARVFAVDPAYFRQRHDAKARAGIAAFSQAPKTEGDV